MKRIVSCLLLSVALLVSESSAQNPEDLPLFMVVREAQAMIAKGDLVGALPYLDELEDRFSTTEDENIRTMVQRFSFLRGKVYLQCFEKDGNQEHLRKAAKAFGFFAEKFPDDPHAVSAMQERTDCLLALQEWAEAARVIETVLDEKKPYRKQILKRSDLMKLLEDRKRCYEKLNKKVPVIRKQASAGLEEKPQLFKKIPDLHPGDGDLRLEDAPLRFIVERTEVLTSEGKFAELIPFLDELEDRFSKTEDENIRPIVQRFSFLRGIGFLQAFANSNDKADLQKAANAFADFAAAFPEDLKAAKAREMRDKCHEMNAQKKNLGQAAKARTMIQVLLKEIKANNKR